MLISDPVEMMSSEACMDYHASVPDIAEVVLV